MQVNKISRLVASFVVVSGLFMSLSVNAQETIDPQKVAQRLQEVATSLQRQPSPEQLAQVQQLVLQLQLVQAQLPQQLEILEQTTKRHAQLTELFQSLNQTLINKGLGTQSGAAGQQRR